ncbi:MAG: aspartate 1-decarboxylase [Candidatus Omnitrophica bacterium]|nr:aspartate 1-decarboxylase [Candidatus Omnitrophota bacterium]MBD3268654.1 aspartate 1-decarboxylase [Candidatus Omnitrophota bacterium]
MMRIMLKSKISYAVITDLQLYYKGSITIDEEIMEGADLKEGERVDVLNLNTGGRLQTYVIKGERGSGLMCLNGPAARCGYKGDKIIIISYALYAEDELKNFKSRYIELDEKNKIKNTYLA